MLLTLFIIFTTSAFAEEKEGVNLFELTACQDLYARCEKVICTDPMGKEICAKTCGLCGTTPLPTVIPVCNDLYSQCESTICADAVGKKVCAKTCGLCGTTPPPTVIPTCEDKYSKCKTDINCKSALAKELCAKTCRFCDDSVPSAEGPPVLECSYLCKPLRPMCEFIDWISGTISSGFCFRCTQCK